MIESLPTGQAQKYFYIVYFFSTFFFASTFLSSCSPDGRSLPVSHGSKIPMLTFLDPSHNIYPIQSVLLSSLYSLWLPWQDCLETLFHFKGLNQSLSHLLPPRSNFHKPTEEEIKSIILPPFFVVVFTLTCPLICF